MDLASASSVLRLLADPTRVRLLALLEHEELTVAELAAVLHLAQPRVSTHLAKLKEAGLVRDRRAGVSAYYRANSEGEEAQRKLLDSLRQSIDDALLREDMERHYSPGRTWETLARSLLQLLETGDVLDIASGDGITAELLAPHARSITCVDSSERVVDAAAKRLRAFTKVQVIHGDMQALDLGEQRFDLVLMLHALTYAENPAKAIAEASRVLRAGGRLLAVTLGQHDHRTAVEPFDHRNLGFSGDQLRELASSAGLDVISCHQISRERKAPHFEVISLLARKPH
jgi:DNA-binding transcriptional ArsR family regulator